MPKDLEMYKSKASEREVKRETLKDEHISKKG
jgi:hypothetical protein